MVCVPLPFPLISLPPPPSPPPPLPGLTAEQLQLFIPRLLSAIHIEALVIGNISREVGGEVHCSSIATLCYTCLFIVHPPDALSWKRSNTLVNRYACRYISFLYVGSFERCVTS